MTIALHGEIALPTNPNCVLFATEARTAVQYQGWRGLQKAAAHALELFYVQSGIDCVAWFGRRVSLDRRNRPIPQITLSFVFDGPADKEALALLDKGALQSEVRWGTSSVEPLPAQAFPSLCVKSGKLYQLWSRTQEGPRCLAFEADGDAVQLVHRTVETATTADFLPFVRHVEAAARTLSSTDHRLDTLRVAFAHHYAQRIIEADGVIQPDEVEFMEQVFPNDLFAQMGLSDSDTLEAAVKEAEEQLPGLLGHHDKLALIGLFFSVCHSDGKLDAREMKVLKTAADVLGIEPADVVDYLRRLW